MKYEWRGAAAPTTIPVEVAAREVQRIIARDGGAEPPTIVQEARPETAPLHPAFEWRDPVAAERYREEQARQLVRSIVLVPEPEKREQGPTVRAFVSISKPDGEHPQSRHYRPLLDVLTEPEAADEVKRRFRTELLRMRQRYLDLVETDELLRHSLDSLVAAVAS